jgi:hypothetical protein
MSAFSDKTHYSCYIEGYNAALRDSNAADLYEALEWVKNNPWAHRDNINAVVNAAIAKSRGEA